MLSSIIYLDVIHLISTVGWNMILRENFTTCPQALKNFSRDRKIQVFPFLFPPVLNETKYFNDNALVILL